jgi:hypothetical protein
VIDIISTIKTFGSFGVKYANKNKRIIDHIPTTKVGKCAHDINAVIIFQTYSINQLPLSTDIQNNLDT